MTKTFSFYLIYPLSSLCDSPRRFPIGAAPDLETKKELKCEDYTLAFCLDMLKLCGHPKGNFNVKVSDAPMVDAMKISILNFRYRCNDGPPMMLGPAPRFMIELVFAAYDRHSMEPFVFWMKSYPML